jgi:hypothetical protein
MTKRDLYRYILHNVLEINNIKKNIFDLSVVCRETIYNI